MTENRSWLSRLPRFGRSPLAELDLIDEDDFDRDDEIEAGDERESAAGSDLIAFEHVSKSVGRGKARRLVLDDVNVTFRRGVFTGVLTKQDAGRVSLINMINANANPDSGIVRHGMTASWPLTQRTVMRKSRTLRNNIRIIAAMYNGWAPEVIDAVCDLAKIRRQDLDKEVRALPPDIPGHAAVALAYVLKFDCFVAGETLCIGTPQFRERMIELFMASKPDHSIIIITKSVPIIQQVCDECHVLDGATLRSYDTITKAIHAFKSSKANVADIEDDSDGAGDDL